MASPALSIAANLRTSMLAPIEARLLLQHVLGWDHARLVAHSDEMLDRSVHERFLALAARRLAGEPIAYLLGSREFFGRTFAVDKSVLIPRPETERLVELALERIPVGQRCRILDLGTGSGNIAITLALERPTSAVDAIDASAAALRTAQANACQLHANNVRFAQGSWFEPVSAAAFDLIASNPPYVAELDPHLDQGDLRFEPKSALAAGPEGLDAIAAIIRGAAQHLFPGGWLLLEHGYDQGEAIAAMLRAAGFQSPLLAYDLAGLPRVSGAQI